MSIIGPGAAQSAGVPLAEIPTASAWCLRWRGRRHSWRRPEDGGFDPARYEVRPVGETAAKAYVIANHYSGSYPAALHRFGLFDVSGGVPRLAGAAVFGVPVQVSVLSNSFPDLVPFLNQGIASIHSCRSHRRRPVRRHAGRRIDRLGSARRGDATTTSGRRA